MTLTDFIFRDKNHSRKKPDLKYPKCYGTSESHYDNPKFKMFKEDVSKVNPLGMYDLSANTTA